jgi:hypothetical protein
MTECRKATLFDVPQLVALGRQMHAESRYADLPFDPAVLATSLTQMLTDQFVYVVERDGVLLGGMVGCLYPSWFGTGLMASDLALFVAPDRRGGIAAVQLVAAFKAWAAAMDALEITCGVTTGVHEAATDKLYRRLDFVPSGTAYKWRPAPCAQA